MTREKLWEIVTTKLVWCDYYSGESEPSEEIKEILTNSLLIPKPKFKVGDWVKRDDAHCFCVYWSFYDFERKECYYKSQFGDGGYDSTLELIVEGYRGTE